MLYNPAIHHRRSIRMKDYDYAQSGMYFVTICCQHWICRFGKIENGEMILNEWGQIAYNEWMKTPDIRSNIQLDAFAVMPNHIHGIIIITDVGGCRGVSHTPHDEMRQYNNLGVCDTPLRSPSNTVGASVRGYKSAVTKQIGYSVWQRNYYEHIIRNEKSHQHIANYIINNPIH